MTITLELLPDVEASLTAQAQGLQLNTYVQVLLEQQAAAKKPADTLSLEQLEAKLDALAQGSESLPYLPPEATTREGLYRDHD